MKERIEKLQQKLENGTAMLVVSEPNLFYLTGMLSSEGKLLITENGGYFLVDFRYIEHAKNTVKDCRVLCVKNFNTEIQNLLKQNNIKKLYIETEAVSFAQYQNYLKAFEFAEISSDNSLDTALKNLRRIKDNSELAKIKEAQLLTDETFSYICGRIEAGRTEREIMLDMEFNMRKAGAQGVSFDFIVVSGKNSSMPHGVPSDKRLEKGDFITMDFGAVVDGYRSDMTRTVALGNVSAEQKKVYDTVLSAQSEALKNITPGKKCSDIDKIARDIIDNAGYRGAFGHSLGHSVGIEIHESPNFSPGCETLLEPGMVLTVEPGIYLENKFGVRIEDMIFVTEDGCEDITKSTKELLVL
ncbi:MAG: aminopeptidase P family protein [Clostridiales bacterium]|nr:aminopeptidase P family protein [Candidatus Equinaster intestinalis]